VSVSAGAGWLAATAGVVAGTGAGGGRPTKFPHAIAAAAAWWTVPSRLDVAVAAPEGADIPLLSLSL
jgi:hypothetical protein